MVEYHKNLSKKLPQSLQINLIVPIIPNMGCQLSYNYLKTQVLVGKTAKKLSQARTATPHSKDDFIFLWKRAILRHWPNQNQLTN
jgi:hypothetical protein